MRIVIAGGTGFIGSAVTERLAASGEDEILVTSRRPESARTPPGVRAVQAFAGDALSLGKVFTGADVVVQCIQFPNHPVEKPSKGWTYENVDGRGTQVAVEVAKKLGVRRFVYVSGAGAGRGLQQPWFRAKDRAEAAIRESGLEHVILRPSWVYGPDDRSMNRFIAFCRRLPVVPVIGDGQSSMNPLFLDDLASSLATAVRQPDAKEVVLDIGGPDRLTNDEVIRTIQRVLRRRCPLVHQPASLVKIGAKLLSLLPTPPLSPAAVDFILQDVPLDPEPAMAYFGRRFLPLEQGLRTYVRGAA